jgi:heme/copper-type cytochrome/quinol oxidase subunit 2
MDWQGNPTERIHTTYQPYVDKNRLVMSDRKSHMTHYEIVKTSRRRQENIALPFNKRLLRTRRTVVLPAHVNITVITNSFDVVHSWFIPGLGVKLDCIPGRSTHHVLHIDNVGFYYGQCAEICGRYHHHMPIRICALPFEHFMVWWHAFAMPRMLKAYEEPLVNFKKDRYFYSAKKYVW